MARITPSGNVADLEDDQPYTATLNAIDIGNGDFGRQLIVDWDLEDGSSIRDWLGLSVGMSNKGAPSKLRQLCNALSDRQALDEVSFFDDETYEWGYQGADGPADNKLTPGMDVVFLGSHVQKKDGSGTRFGIQKYKRVMRQKAAKPRVVESLKRDEKAGWTADDVDPDEAPF